MPTIPPRIGVFGIGLAAYWDQFAGLKERLEGYQRAGGNAHPRVRRGRDFRGPGGYRPSGARRRSAFCATEPGSADLLRGHLRHVVAGAAGGAEGRRPGAGPESAAAAALDYEHTDTAEWLANCSVCCVPEIANAFTRARIDFHVVSGILTERCRGWREIEEWCRAAAVARAVRPSRIGFLGHTYPGMLDMYSDFTTVHAQLGAHIEVLEMDDLAKAVAAASPRRRSPEWRSVQSL